MRAAKPYPFEVSATAQASALAATKPNGKPGTTKAQIPATGTADLISIQSFAVPLGSYSSYPYSAVGKLFFNQSGGSYVCSAAFVKGHGIWTAGHCVHAGNNSSAGWSTNVVFVPQYRDGLAPLGQCAVGQLWTTTDWYTNGNPNGLDHDYAGGSVTCNATSSAGYLGLAWNYAYNQTYNALGYPAAAPFTGGRMIGCTAAFSQYGFGTPTTYGIVCDMTGGSSGGPWYISGYYINGNTSYGDSRYPGKLFSPYYDAGVKSLWDLLPS
jgi:V8-like Glu-specific endopeptidase